MPSGDVLVLVDESGRVVEWGRPAEELFGWSAEEAVGQSVSTLMREAATDGEGWRGKFTDAAAVLVKPVLRGTSVVWQVLSAGDTMSGQDVAILKAVFTHSPVGLHVLDDQLRVVRMSTTTGGPRDAEVERLVGKQFTEAYELANPEEESAVAQRVLDSGVPVVNRLVRRITSPGRPARRIHSVSYFRLEDPNGDAVGLVASAVDVTEREKAQNRLAFLDTVRARVGHRLNVMDVCRELVEAVVPAFAGIADIEVIEDVVGGEDPPWYPSPGTFHCAEQPSKAELRITRTESFAPCRSESSPPCRSAPPSQTSCPTFGHASYRSRRTARGLPPTRPEPKSSGNPVRTP